MKLEKNKVEIIEFDLTTICNAKCPLCYRNYKNYNEKYSTPFYRSYDEITNQILDYPNLKIVYLIGQLSEPTTHPDFLKIVKFIKNRNLKIKICTNGDLYDDIFWNKLGSILDDEDEIWFTICGSTEKLHQHYRVNTKLENILHHAEIIRKHHKIDCAKCIRFIYNSENLDSDEFKYIIKDFSQIEFTNTNFPLDRKDFKNDFNYFDFLPVKKIYDDYKKLNNVAEFYSRMNRKDIYCQSISDNSIQIDAFGDIYPCYVFMEQNNRNKWNCNYGDILNGKYDCCKFCNRKIVEYCNKKERNSII